MSGSKLQLLEAPSQLSLKSESQFNEQDAIFERAIIIIPYKQPDTVK